jgi:tetratricopeptide (TPR) repeat protein
MVAGSRVEPPLHHGPAILKIVITLAFVAASCTLQAQTYQLGPGASSSNDQKQADQAPGLGWGSNIENARLARAAQQALQHGDRARGLDLARRAAEAAPNDPQLWFLAGYAARLNSRYQESIDFYKRGLHLNPNAPDGRSGLAQDLILVGQTQEAERLLKQVVAANPNRPDDVRLLGELSMKSRDYSSAVDWLNKAEAAKPEARTELLLSISYAQIGSKDLASKYLNLAKNRDPNNPEVQRSLAGYYREAGKYSEAIAALQSIRGARPDVIAELAYTYQLAGKFKESAKAYAQAADASPKDLELQLSAAQAEVNVSSYSTAESYLERAAKLDPGSYRLHGLRGELARAQDKDELAIGEYNKALASLPPNPAEGPLYGIQLRMDLVLLYRKARNTSAADSQLQSARAEIASLDGSVTQGPYLRLRALIKLASGDFDGALADIKNALAIEASDRDDWQIEGDIQMKMGHTTDAIAAYDRVLTTDPANAPALISLGYAYRADGRQHEAEKSFQRLMQVDPSSYVPYLALGDLYTAERSFSKAQAAYAKGYELAPKQPLIVAGGLNAAVEGHDMAAGAQWESRVTEEMSFEPELLREEERYLSFKGDYAESAQIGEKAIQALPSDRDVVVYLGYDLLHLGRYDDLLKLTSQYNNVLAKEPDIPLLAGYVHKQKGQLEQARLDFSDVLHRDPSVVTAYVNRGFVLDDLHQPAEAASDFESALKREPDNGEAHLGLAYAELASKRLQSALRQAGIASKELGDSRDIHVIRATAFGLEGMLAKAAVEYRAAIRFAPDDAALHLGLGHALYGEHLYHNALGELETAERLSPHDAEIAASLALCYANLHDREQTLRYVQVAESSMNGSPDSGKDPSQPTPTSILLSTGEALYTVGERQASMERFRRALDEKSGDRISIRLAVAQIMAQQQRPDEAQREVALALMEAEAGDTAPPSGTEYIAAADVLRSLHNYPLSQDYLERAKTAGAPDAEVRIGMANNYLALGDTPRAKAELDAVSAAADNDPDYQYLMTRATMLEQEHEGSAAMTSFAQASEATNGDETAEDALLREGANEGMRLTPEVSVLSNFSVEPIFEDSTVYVLDAKLDAAFAVPNSDTSLLPPPRSSLETQNTDAFHLHLGPAIPIGGFFQLRDANGQISVPALNSIVNRNTIDTNFNIGLSPTVRLGRNALTIDSGIQETIRRDTESPVEMNQNLFRLFTYVSTSAFFNEVSMNGYVIRESGPFTETNLSSRDFSAALNFRVGAPWGKTALVTGWGSDDQTFQPESYENYLTSAYAGIDRKFGEHVDFQGIAEDLRSWRVVANRSGIAQNLRPAGSLSFSPARNWEVQAAGAWSSTRSFHIYDAIQSGISVSYMKPLGRIYNDESQRVDLKYPIRFSAGLQEESFFNFPGGHNQQFRPYVSINIF